MESAIEHFVLSYMSCFDERDIKKKKKRIGNVVALYLA